PSGDRQHDDRAEDRENVSEDVVSFGGSLHSLGGPLLGGDFWGEVPEGCLGELAGVGGQIGLRARAQCMYALDESDEERWRPALRRASVVCDTETVCITFPLSPSISETADLSFQKSFLFGDKIEGLAGTNVSTTVGRGVEWAGLATRCKEQNWNH